MRQEGHCVQSCWSNAHGPTNTNMPYCKANGLPKHDNERRKTLLATSNSLTLTRLNQ